MFDDYDFKNTGKRIKMCFRQVREETMYPWEIAGFLNELNTSYYKFELLNSVSSALKNGISPDDIFIFDSSLPLYERYSSLNLVSEEISGETFYRIGLPYPLKPNAFIYQYHLLCEAFSTVNSFLYSNHVRPLRINNINSAYRRLINDSLDEAELLVIALACESIEKNKENSAKKNKPAINIGREDVISSLSRYQKKKAKLLKNVEILETLSSVELLALEKSKFKEEKRLNSVNSAFFYYFQKTIRPLVCARVGDGQIRVLGRSLVNKTEATGLELIQATRNSPLLTEIGAGVSILQTVFGISHAREMQKLQLDEKKLLIEEKRVDIELKKALTHKTHLEAQKLALESYKLAADLQKTISDTAGNSDLPAINQVQSSFTKLQIEKAYQVENQRSRGLLDSRGLALDVNSIQVIDESA